MNGDDTMATMDKKKRFLFIIAVALTILTLLFVILRTTHVILRIGDKYTMCFQKNIVYGERDINNENVKELVYAKNVTNFSSMNTSITNFDFLSVFTHLESLTVAGDNYQGITINHLPSLENSPQLNYANLYIDVENLDFLSESSNLEYLAIVSRNTEIQDIAGLQNKPKLRYLRLDSVHCSDYSVLLDMPSLKSLHIDEAVLPDDIFIALEEKGVSMSHYDEEKEEWVKNVRSSGN